MLNKKILFSFALLVLNFCAIAQKKNPDDTIEKPVEKGIIFGSISLENWKKVGEFRWFCYKNDSIDRLIKYEEWRRGRSTSTRHWFSVGIKNYGFEYKINNKKVYFFALKKTVGKYYFYTIETFLNSGYMQSAWAFPIDVPFEVEANKTKYIGELNYNEKDGKFQLIDNFKSDSARFAKHYPQLDFSNAQ